MKRLILPLLVLSLAPSAKAQDAGFVHALKAISGIVLPEARADFNDPDRLLDLSKDSDPGVRANAVRSLRYYVQNYRVQDRLAELISDDRENEAVRKEAMRAASALNNGRAVDNMYDIAKGWKTASRELRLFSLKALFNAAAYNSSVRGELADIAKGWGQNDLGLRAAACWGLWQSSQSDYSARSVLLDIAASSSQPEAVRFEALKSLYLAMGDWSVASKMMDLAKDSSAPESLRYGAVLAHAAKLNDWSTKSFLEDLARSSSAPASLRQAAVIAMGGPDRPEVYGYFHLSWRDWNTGVWSNPIDGQP